MVGPRSLRLKTGSPAENRARCRPHRLGRLRKPASLFVGRRMGLPLPSNPNPRSGASPIPAGAGAPAMGVPARGRSEGEAGTVPESPILLSQESCGTRESEAFCASEPHLFRFAKAKRVGRTFRGQAPRSRGGTGRQSLKSPLPSGGLAGAVPGARKIFPLLLLTTMHPGGRLVGRCG